MPAARGTILIVEDSRQSAEVLASIVEEEGFKPEVCADGETALRAFRSRRPSAVLLGWILPDRPGIEVCRQLREEDRVIPLVLIGSRDDEATIVGGLGAGADDFVGKPVRRAELLARLEAHLRKAAAVDDAAGAEAGSSAVRRFGAVELDPAARVVRSAGREVALGPLEFKLLEHFSRHAGIAISREQILNEVYGYEADISTERVDLLVRRLRSKLGEGHEKGGQLVAVPGFGYRLERRREAARGPRGPC